MYGVVQSGGSRKFYQGLKLMYLGMVFWIFINTPHNVGTSLAAVNRRETAFTLPTARNFCISPHYRKNTAGAKFIVNCAMIIATIIAGKMQ
jgi:hypothetical protein